ncbi:MAG: hypothetical protein PHG83_03575 [Patescibacteria group bacterium]|nr:hypothetical protein [Patescibacteria group bacterium]
MAEELQPTKPNGGQPTQGEAPTTLADAQKEIKDQKVDTEKSFIQPTQGEAPITLADAQKEITIAIESAKKDFLDETSKEIRKQVQTDKASLITVFGIFASITSFLTIEFQFLRTICSFEKIIGFTLILASLLLCFNLALDYLVKSRTDKDTPKPNIFFSVFLVILFILGICFMYSGNEEKCKDNKIYEKYLESFENQQKEFNQSYVNEQSKKYNEIEVEIGDIKNQIKK